MSAPCALAKAPWLRAFAAVASIVVFCIAALPAARADPHDEPIVALTPGAIVSEDLTRVCRAGYAGSVRPRGHFWRRLRDEAYDRYGLQRGHRSTIDAAGQRHPAYEIDHLVPLELRGAPSDLRNLWPQPLVAAMQKDRIENDLHALVCNGTMKLADAQRAIAHDWKTALRNSTPRAFGRRHYGYPTGTSARGLAGSLRMHTAGS